MLDALEQGMPQPLQLHRQRGGRHPGCGGKLLEGLRAGKAVFQQLSLFGPQPLQAGGQGLPPGVGRGIKRLPRYCQLLEQPAVKDRYLLIAALLL